jgi:hypothetical protein
MAVARVGLLAVLRVSDHTAGSIDLPGLQADFSTAFCLKESKITYYRHRYYRRHISLHCPQFQIPGSVDVVWKRSYLRSILYIKITLPA